MWRKLLWFCSDPPFILFFSSSECDYHVSQEVHLSRAILVYEQEWEHVKNAAKAANPDGNYDSATTIHFRAPFKIFVLRKLI